MLASLDNEIDSKVIINHKYETTFDVESFLISRKLINNYIDVSLTVTHVKSPIFGQAYHLEFFGYAAKYSGWYVCAKVEPYISGKSHVIFMRIIPLVEEGKQNAENQDSSTNHISS